jgi:hypothetical protein
MDVTDLRWSAFLLQSVVYAHMLGIRSDVPSCSFLQLDKFSSRTHLVAAKAPSALKNMWFHASSREAELLYKGCGRSNVSSRSPSFVILGVQKAGTSSVTAALRNYTCRSIAHEPHFFDSGNYSDRPVPAARLNEYLGQQWGHCNQDSILFEKSPSYYWQAWTPLRMCESLGTERPVVLFLRDPVARAYSSFYHSVSDRQLNGEFVLRPRQVALTPEGFDELAQVEVAIVQSCGGVPSGDLQLDLRARANFSACCKSVTKELGFENWNGCECDISHDQICGVFGEKVESQVRMGIYAPYLRNWLQYYQSANVYIYIVEETVFPDMERVVWELACTLFPAKAPASCAGQARLGQNLKLNSASSKQPPMLKQTYNLLKEFYRPFNRELEALIGRSVPW